MVCPSEITDEIERRVVYFQSYFQYVVGLDAIRKGQDLNFGMMAGSSLYVLQFGLNFFYTASFCAQMTRRVSIG